MSPSFTQMQKKLEEAERKIQEQASLFAKTAEDRSRAEAAQQAEMAELSLVKKYLLATDPRFLDFMATETASSAPPPQRFNLSWFDQYGDWLEYNVKKEKAYCFLCYLFRGEKKIDFSKENSLAYYVNCFAHQLQLVVFAVAKKHFEIRNFIEKIYLLVNVVATSCKTKGKMREIERDIIEKIISSGEIKIGKGLNQESSLQRPGRTRWGSHYKTLLQLVEMFSSVDEMLVYVKDEGADLTQRSQANGLLKYIYTFDCVFYLHLMLHILRLTENLLTTLQLKDQDILNDVLLFRDDGWDFFVNDVSSFCEKHDTDILNMEDDFIDPRKPHKKTNYWIWSFKTLSPTASFREFDKENVLRLAKLYSEDFSVVECISLKQQLDIYIDNVQEDERFADLKHLSRVMLSLTLQVATATVKRCFSGMKIVKTILRNHISDQFLSDCLICFIEKKIFEDVANEPVIKRFQAMNKRRVHL
ncbi:hypothetical protein N665_0153s0009 [Sinapis alba]|nr:hypothetical protein N665_0153s0009 [Sinapis alba]